MEMKEKASERFETTLSPQCEQRMIARRKYSLTSSIRLRTTHERRSVYRRSMRDPSLETESFRSSIEEESKIMRCVRSNVKREKYNSPSSWSSSPSSSSVSVLLLLPSFFFFASALFLPANIRTFFLLCHSLDTL